VHEISAPKKFDPRTVQSAAIRPAVTNKPSVCRIPTKLVTITISQSLRASTVGAQDARYITELNAVHPCVSCSREFGAGDGVRTALRAAKAQTAAAANF